MRIRLGLLDGDIRYINRLTDYFSAHFNLQLEANLFTSADDLLDFLHNHGRLDVLLATQELLPDQSILPGRILVAYLCEEQGITAIAGVPAVCKYQKGEAIFRAVQGLAGSLDGGGRKYAAGGDCEIIVFAGAAGGVGCSTAAMSCAARMAAQGRQTLYISLQQCSQSQEVFRVQGKSMTRVRYELKSWKMAGSDDAGKLQMKLQSLLATDPETKVMSYAGFDLPLDAMGLDEVEIENLLKAVSGLCDCCVVDMDGSLSKNFITAVRKAGWLVLVSDGSHKGNRCLVNLIRSIEIQDGTDEPVLRGNLGVLYARFGSAASEAELPPIAKVRGRIPNYSGAGEKRILQELIGSRIFELLES